MEVVVVIVAWILCLAFASVIFYFLGGAVAGILADVLEKRRLRQGK